MPLMNVRERKRALRAQFKKYRSECPEALKQEMDSKLFESFISLEEYKNCDTLFAYISGNIECDTGQIIRQALSDGKRVAVPKCAERSNEMDFYYIKSYEDLVRGKYDIPEPVPGQCEKVGDVTAGLCLVPGLSFDFQGYRLGFGKGYYDRFLSRFGGRTAGICYAKCTVSELPRGVYDRAVDILITERFINRTGM